MLNCELVHNYVLLGVIKQKKRTLFPLFLVMMLALQFYNKYLWTPFFSTILDITLDKKNVVFCSR